MKSDNSERKKAIRKALIELGGKATTAEIAKKAGLPLGHGITQTLNKMENIKCFDEKTKIWQIKTEITNIRHGCYSEESIFDIIQNEYLGAPTGYLELLTINNSPTGKCNFIVHKAVNYGQEGCFAELNSMEDAIEIFKLVRSIIHTGWNKSPKIINFVIYGKNESPWFYSKTEDISK